MTSVLLLTAALAKTGAIDETLVMRVVTADELPKMAPLGTLKVTVMASPVSGVIGSTVNGTVITPVVAPAAKVMVPPVAVKEPPTIPVPATDTVPVSVPNVALVDPALRVKVADALALLSPLRVTVNVALEPSLAAVLPVMLNIVGNKAADDPTADPPTVIIAVPLRIAETGVLVPGRVTIVPSESPCKGTVNNKVVPSLA
jgi:hypothetical protein